MYPHYSCTGRQHAVPRKGGYVPRARYEGFLADGSKFDSSRARGQPIEFVIGQGRVIQGWDRNIVRMSRGQTATGSAAKTRIRTPGISPDHTPQLDFDVRN